MNRAALACPSRDVELRTSTRVSGRGGFHDDRVVTPSLPRATAPCPPEARVSHPAFVLASLITTTAAGRDPRNGDNRPVAAGAVAAAADLPSHGAISNGTVRLGDQPRGTHRRTRRRYRSARSPVRAHRRRRPDSRVLVRGVGRGRSDVEAPPVGRLRPAQRSASRQTSPSRASTSRRTQPTRRSRSVGGSASVTCTGRRRGRSSIRSISPSRTSAASSADVVYRRAMDWDVPPTEFDEFVTIQGSHPRLLDSTDNGFNHVNPLSPLSRPRCARDVQRRRAR